MKKFALISALLCAPAPAWAADTAVCQGAQDGSGLASEDTYLGSIHGGKDGVLFAKRELTASYTIDAPSAAAFTRFAKALKAKGSQGVILLIPPRPVLLANQAEGVLGFNAAKASKAYAGALGQLTGFGFVAPDVLAAVKGQEGLFFARDHHWTPKGAQVSFTALAESLKKHSSFSKLASQSASTSAGESKDYFGTYARAVERACKIKTEAEKITTYTTSTGGGLLGDDAPAPIVLLGTSFSNKGQKDLFNAGGFFQEALGVAVQNAAVEGGGQDTSIVSYFANGAFAKNPPAYVVWEVPFYYSLSMSKTLRQVIPAISGVCTGADVLASSTSSVSKDTQLLSVDKAVSSRAGQAYLALKASDAALVTFKLKLEYAGGKSETVDINRSTRVANNGLFFLELAHDNLTRASLKAEGKASGKIEATLCAGSN